MNWRKIGTALETIFWRAVVAGFVLALLVMTWRHALAQGAGT